MDRLDPCARTQEHLGSPPIHHGAGHRTRGTARHGPGVRSVNVGRRLPRQDSARKHAVLTCWPGGSHADNAIPVRRRSDVTRVRSRSSTPADAAACCRRPSSRTRRVSALLSGNSMSTKVSFFRSRTPMCVGGASARLRRRHPPRGEREPGGWMVCVDKINHSARGLLRRQKRRPRLWRGTSRALRPRTERQQ